MLLVDELATSTVVHGDGTFEVRYEIRPDQLAVTVTDHGEGRPEVRPAPVTQEHGRGLRLVETLAANWGVCPLEQGKQVWFRMALPPRTH